MKKPIVAALVAVAATSAMAGASWTRAYLVKTEYIGHASNFQPVVVCTYETGSIQFQARMTKTICPYQVQYSVELDEWR